MSTQPPSESNEDIWASDLLDRRSEGRFLISFLTRRVNERAAEGRSKSYVLNLDAGWGEGKTHFLNCLRKQLDTENYLVTYVNAWRDDHADTPLIAVMAAIESCLKPYFKKKTTIENTWKVITEAGGQLAVSAAKGAIKQATKKALGSEFMEDFKDALEASGVSAETIDDATEKAVEKLTDTAGDMLLRSFRERTASIDTFKDKLEVILEAISKKSELSLPLFILVDELDRCRPTYAISMLEQIKHLFDINNVVFIIATDSRQLAHAIKAVYGSSFESDQYLKRFFDRKYIFEKKPMSRYVEYLFQTHIDTKKIATPHSSDTPEKYFEKHMVSAGLSLRDADQCADLLRNVITIWDKPIHLQLVYLLPLIIAHHTGRHEWFSALAEGNKTKPANPISFPWTYEMRPSEGRPEHVSCDALITSVLSLINKPMGQALNEKGGSAAFNFARKILVQEIHTLHEGVLRNEVSVLKSYPSLVSSAGRLSHLIDNQS